MKITNKRLKEIIREEIQNLNEGLPWEQELDENWFGDLKAKAQKAYLKANPNSKYAGKISSGLENREKAKEAEKKYPDMPKKRKEKLIHLASMEKEIRKLSGQSGAAALGMGKKLTAAEKRELKSYQDYADGLTATLGGKDNIDRSDLGSVKS
tara:strand:+ start:252 stop:710 length:459 start_codon:yes stop_codon:yes gene_type:complete